MGPAIKSSVEKNSGGTIETNRGGTLENEQGLLIPVLPPTDEVSTGTVSLLKTEEKTNNNNFKKTTYGRQRIS